MKHKFFTNPPVILTLKNGMKVHLIYDQSVATYVEVSVPFGSIHLDYQIDGINYKLPPGSAHFYEHKIFAMSDGDAFKKLSQLGLAVNAMTSYHATSYILSGIDNVMYGVEYLLEMLDTPYFTDENVAQEEKIIKEELNMYENEVDWKLQTMLLEQMFLNHPLKYDIGGSVESIKEISKETLNQIHDHFYHPANRTLVISGPIDLDEYIGFFTSYDSQLPKYNPPIFYYGDEPNYVKEVFSRVKLNLPMEKLILGIKINTSEMPDNKIKNEIQAVSLLNLLIGTTSQFYEKNLKEGLINYHFNYQLIDEGGQFICLILANSIDTDTLFANIMQVIIQDGQKLLNEHDFENLKRAYLGSYIQTLNDYEYKTYLYTKSIVDSHSLDEVIETIKEMTFEDVLNFYEHLLKSQFTRIHVDK